MPITNISRDWGTFPSIVRITSTDDLASITSAGYLFNEQNNITIANGGDFQWNESDLILIYYSPNSWAFFQRNSLTDSLTVVIGEGTSGITPTEIQNEEFSYSDDTGTADAYIGTYTPIPVLQEGTRLGIKVSTTNLTTSPTFDCGDGSGALPIVISPGVSVQIGDIPTGHICWLTFDGVKWQLENPLSSSTSLVQTSGTFTPTVYGIVSDYPVTVEGRFVKTGSNMYVNIQINGVSFDTPGYVALNGLPGTTPTSSLLQYAAANIYSQFSSSDTLAQSGTASYAITSFKTSDIGGKIVSSIDDKLIVYNILFNNSSSSVYLESEDPAYPMTVANTPLELLEFFDSGNQYIVSLEGGGNSFETFLYDIPISLFTTTTTVNANQTCGSIFNYGGNLHLVTVTGVGKNNLETFQWTGTSWSSIGTPVSIGANTIGAEVFLDGSTTYGVFSNTTNAETYAFTGTTWVLTDTLSNGAINGPSIWKETNGTVYMAYLDSSDYLTIYVWSGTTWNFVINQIISFTPHAVVHTKLNGVNTILVAGSGYMVSYSFDGSNLSEASTVSSLGNTPNYINTLQLFPANIAQLATTCDALTGDLGWTTLQTQIQRQDSSLGGLYNGFYFAQISGPTNNIIISGTYEVTD